jgi:peptidyl-prolyl cis-trans isomerase B (cyclophilin B)
MNFRFFKSAALALLVGATALTPAQSATVGPELAVIELGIDKEKQSRQVIIGLYDDAAPATVANFKALARRGFYRGIRFHRIFPNTLVQTGDPLTRVGWFRPRRPLRAGTGGPGYTVPAELGVKAVRGSVAMSRLPDKINPTKSSNGSQFFVTLNPEPELDNKYTVFGEILEGLDILDEISNLPADSNDFPLPNIVIRSIKIVPRFAAPTGS